MLIFTSPIYKDLAALIIAAGTGRDFVARGVQASAITGKLALHLLSQTLPAFLQTFGTCSLVPAWSHVACSHRKPQLGWYPRQHRAGTVALLPCARCCLPWAGVQQSKAGDPQGPLTAPGTCLHPPRQYVAGVIPPLQRTVRVCGSGASAPLAVTVAAVDPPWGCWSPARPAGAQQTQRGSAAALMVRREADRGSPEIF